MTEFAFNHDGFGALEHLADTDMTEADAVAMLVQPIVDSKLTAIDWCTLTTGEHNCRTRHRRGVDRDSLAFYMHRIPEDVRIVDVIDHYNDQPLDLLDIVVKHGHANGLKVYGNVRLNHYLNPNRLADCPGEVNFCSWNGIKKDFRQWKFHEYLAELFEDLLEKGVDGLSLDFERKAPFFPPGAPQEERYQATKWFLRRIRKLTDKPILVRVAHEEEKGREQGQNPIAWMEEGLVDVVIPATHNHEPEPLDWPIDRFVEAARKSPRPCRIWPQIWPTGEDWTEDSGNKHLPEAVLKRVRQLLDQGADGVYFFNFCCFYKGGDLFQTDDLEIFKNLGL